MIKSINFITVHYLPENRVGVARVLPLVEELSKYYKVNIICLSEKGTFQKESQVKNSSNITIHYINQNTYDGIRMYSRALSEIKYCLQLVQYSKKINSDLTIVTVPYMFLLPLVGYMVSGIKILDIRDLQWTYIPTNTLINSLIKKSLSHLMYLSMKRFSYITTANESQKCILNNKYRISNVHKISNGISLEHYNFLVNSIYNRPDIFTITYAGTIGMAQDLWIMIDAAKKLPEVKFIIIGSGIQVKELENYTIINNIHNVFFPGKIDWNNVVEYYKQSSILFTQLIEDITTAQPVKLYEYASTGLPIIFSGFGEAREFTKTLENTTVINSNDVEAFIYAIKEYMMKTSIISNKNRNLIKQNFIREEIAKDFIHLVNTKVIK